MPYLISIAIAVALILSYSAGSETTNAEWRKDCEKIGWHRWEGQVYKCEHQRGAQR